jgi:peroxiredoxin
MTSEAVAKELDLALDHLLASDSPLSERLASYADTVRQSNRAFAEAVDRLVVRLTDVGAGNNSPQLGDVFQPFLLPDENGHLISLDDLLGSGPLVVAFRRGHWCPYCVLSTEDLARLQMDILKCGGHLVVISPEREAFSKKLKDKTGATFRVLSDIDNGYALSLGLAISVGEEMRSFMSNRGRDLPLYQGNDAWMLPIPATFVLDPTGIIVMRHVDVDYRSRAASADIMATLERLAIKA